MSKVEAAFYIAMVIVMVTISLAIIGMVNTSYAIPHAENKTKIVGSAGISMGSETFLEERHDKDIQYFVKYTLYYTNFNTESGDVKVAFNRKLLLFGEYTVYGYYDGRTFIATEIK